MFNLSRYSPYIVNACTDFIIINILQYNGFSVRAGIQENYSVDSHNINIRKWLFSDQEVLNDAAVVGLELKNAYDHLLAASTYAGYDIW